VYIERNGNLLYSHTIDSASYLSNVYYDRITGYLSFNKCTTIYKQDWFEEWVYDLVVWDYKNDNIFQILTDTTYNGEGLSSPQVINYNANNHTGLIMTYGWEWYGISYFNNGNITHFPSLYWDYVEVIGIINEEEIILQVDHGDSESNQFIKFNIVTNVITPISEERMIEYTDLMLNQFGKNIFYYDNKFNDSIRLYYGTDWAPDGKRLIYSDYNSRMQERYYFYLDIETMTDEWIPFDNYGLYPIWK
jgi:hypothetical protein